MAMDDSEKTKIEAGLNQYVAKYRCPNCGTVFEKAVRKGVPSLGMGGECPNCAVRDGAAAVGNFQVIKENPQLDSIRSYN